MQYLWTEAQNRVSSLSLPASGRFEEWETPSPEPQPQPSPSQRRPKLTIAEQLELLELMDPRTLAKAAIYLKVPKWHGKADGDRLTDLIVQQLRKDKKIGDPEIIDTLEKLLTPTEKKEWSRTLKGMRKAGVGGPSWQRSGEAQPLQSSSLIKTGKDSKAVFHLEGWDYAQTSSDSDTVGEMARTRKRKKTKKPKKSKKTKKPKKKKSKRRRSKRR